MPTFRMSVYLLPTTLYKRIDRIMNEYCGKDNGDAKSKVIHWCRWHKIFMSKLQDGLGFKRFHIFNVALLGKQAEVGDFFNNWSL